MVVGDITLGVPLGLEQGVKLVVLYIDDNLLVLGCVFLDEAANGAHSLTRPSGHAH